MHTVNLANITENPLENQLIQLEHQVINLEHQLVNISSIFFINNINPTIQYFVFIGIFLLAISCFLPCILSTVIRATLCMILKSSWKCLTCVCRRKSVKVKEINSENEKIDDKEQKLIAA